MNIKPMLWKEVKVKDGLLAERQKTIAKKTLTHIYNQYVKKGRIGAVEWQPGRPNKPHYYYDSDVAKLIEATAYSMVEFPNPALKNKIEKVIDSLITIQEPDGYLNSYFHNVAPTEKWTDLRIKHELYCAGHLIEAAIAWKQAVGEDKLLKAMCKYADLIYDKFGKRKGQKYSFPGHQEIELALVKLYHLTGGKKYLKLAEYFVSERGTNNSYWFEEGVRNEVSRDIINDSLLNFQAHVPTKQQKTAEGHAVRACYFYTAMTDIAIENGDKELWNACKKIWRNIVSRRMNVTGGIGSGWQTEDFTCDYDLPEGYYYETCAQISLFFFAWRMFLKDQNGEYGDIMELTMYNSILSGIDVFGKAFFYSNPLNNFKTESQVRNNVGLSERLEDFNCSCCPPNISRFIASIGQYIYAVAEDSVWINLFIDSETVLETADGSMALRMQTNYPEDENISIKISVSRPVHCKLYVRIPAWSRKFKLKINNSEVYHTVKNGYICIERTWKNGDWINLYLPMPVEMVEAHSAVRQVAGKVALKRGPVVYCMEGVDNEGEVFNIHVPTDTEFNIEKQDIAGFELPVIKFHAAKKKTQQNEILYHPLNSEYKKVQITAIPYFMWANRGENEMIIWLKYQL